MNIEKRKGVSPIVATVILVMISVAAGILLWTWVSGAISRPYTSEQQALQERIKIAGIRLSQGSVTIHVLNMGSANVKLVFAQILDSNGQAVCGHSIDTTLNARSAAQQVITCSITSPGVYEVVVITEKGTEARYTFIV